MGLYFTRVFWEGEDRSEDHVNTQVPWIVNFLYSLFLTFFTSVYKTCDGGEFDINTSLM